MFKLKTECLNLNDEDIIEIIKNIKKIKEYIEILSIRNGIFNQGMSIDEKIAKAISLYHSTYRVNLNNNEKTIIALYLIINNDEKFLQKYLLFKGDFSLIGKYFGVSKEFAYLRWLIYRKIKKYENNLIEIKKDTKKLALINDQKNDSTPN